VPYAITRETVRFFSRRSANAARKSAQCLTKSERAWLLISPDSFTLVTSNRFDWVIKNVGKTTARITEANVRCRTCVGMEKLLGQSPDYGMPIPVYETPVAPDPFETQDGRTSGLTADDLEGIRNKGVDLVAYGYVKYIDAFGESHETRFCSYYAVFRQDFRINLLAPADYHRCT
jgi:hypothetical protein